MRDPLDPLRMGSLLRHGDWTGQGLWGEDGRWAPMPRGPRMQHGQAWPVHVRVGPGRFAGLGRPPARLRIIEPHGAPFEVVARRQAHVQRHGETVLRPACVRHVGQRRWQRRTNLMHLEREPLRASTVRYVVKHHRLRHLDAAVRSADPGEQRGYCLVHALQQRPKAALLEHRNVAIESAVQGQLQRRRHRDVLPKLGPDRRCGLGSEQRENEHPWQRHRHFARGQRRPAAFEQCRVRRPVELPNAHKPSLHGGGPALSLCRPHPPHQGRPPIEQGAGGPPGNTLEGPSPIQPDHSSHRHRRRHLGRLGRIVPPSLGPRQQHPLMRQALRRHAADVGPRRIAPGLREGVGRRQQG